VKGIEWNSITPRDPVKLEQGISDSKSWSVTRRQIDIENATALGIASRSGKAGAKEVKEKATRI